MKCYPLPLGGGFHYQSFGFVNYEVLSREARHLFFLVSFFYKYVRYIKYFL